jgi:hypothetical protein
VALSGAAAAAVLGVAGVASAATPDAVTVQSVEAATGIPVRWVDAGRTITVTGLPVSSYTASDAHHATVADMASSTTPNGLGQGAGVPGVGTNPATGTAPATYTQQQVNLQSVGGTIGVGVVSILIIGVVVFFGIKHSKVTLWWGLTLVSLGVLLQPTFIGSTVNSITSSVVTSAASAISGL